MVEEYSSVMTNDVWEVVPRLEDRSIVRSRLIYKIKYVVDGSIKKYKARFMAKGYTQKEGIDDEETFALVARYTSIKSVISLAGQMGWEIHQMDVKTTFLNGVIEEEAYIEQPEGFETHEERTHVCKLKKALYGLKSYRRFIQDYKKNLEATFDMNDMGLMHYFLGLEVWKKNGYIFLGQGRYTTKILKRFRMQDCRPMATPMITNWKKINALEDKEVDPTLYRQLIGSLMYLVNTRLDICFAVNTFSQFMVEPKRVHWATTRRIPRKQNSVALSSAEAEYMAVNIATCEAIWLIKLLVSLFRKRMEATRIYCDNQSCIKLSENPVFHDRLKHIDIRCHFIRDWFQRGAVQL
eukprot:PITA_09141